MLILHEVFDRFFVSDKACKLIGTEFECRWLVFLRWNGEDLAGSEIGICASRFEKDPDCIVITDSNSDFKWRIAKRVNLLSK